MNMTILAATEKQLSFISSLATEILGDDDMAREFVVKLREDGALSSRVLVSGVIDELIAKRNAKRAEAAPVFAELEDGVYVTNDGSMYKVIHAVHGSGKQYAKKIVPPTTPGEKVQFVYAPGAIRGILPEQKITEEQAKEFGILYSQCVNCGRTLTLEESIDRAMGPVCWGRLFGE